MIKINWQTKDGKKIISRTVPAWAKEAIQEIKKAIAKEVATKETVTIIYQTDNKRYAESGKATGSIIHKTKKVTNLKVYVYRVNVLNEQDAVNVLAHEFGHIKDYLCYNFQNMREMEVSADDFAESLNCTKNYKRVYLYAYSNRKTKAQKFYGKQPPKS